MGRNVVDRLKDGGLDAKKGTSAIVALADIYVPREGHPLWHPRAADPIDEAMVADIIEKRRIVHALLVRDDGIEDGRRRLTLIDGSRRTVNGLEAERRMREAGILAADQSLYVEVEFFCGDNAAAWLERLRRNADPLKKPDRASVLAATARHLDALRVELDTIALAMPRGIGRREVQALLQWPNLLPEVAERFDFGAPLVLLRAVLDSPREQQATTLDKLLASGAKSAAGATKVLRREERAAAREAGEKPVRLRPRKFLVTLREILSDGCQRPVDAASLLAFLLGDDKALDGCDSLRDVAKAAGWKGAKDATG